MDEASTAGCTAGCERLVGRRMFLACATWISGSDWIWGLNMVDMGGEVTVSAGSVREICRWVLTTR